MDFALIVYVLIYYFFRLRQRDLSEFGDDMMKMGGIRDRRRIGGAICNWLQKRTFGNRRVHLTRVCMSV